jgi:hypothetical protein
MQVTLKKNLTVNKTQLNKGESGWIRAIQFDSEQNDIYLIDIRGHSLVPVSRGDVEFEKQKP